MSYERISRDAVPEEMLRSVRVMNHARHSMSSIETELSKVMQFRDLDPRLHSEIQSVRDVGTAVSVGLALMGMSVKEMLNEVAKNKASDRELRHEAESGQGQTVKGRTLLGIAKDVVRRRCPLCSEAEIRNRTAYLAARVTAKAP